MGPMLVVLGDPRIKVGLQFVDGAVDLFAERHPVAALRPEGCLGLLVTGPGQFHARLTQVGLHRLRISATDEPLSRVALVAVPADMILVSLPLDTGSTAIWGGIRVGAGKFTTLGPGQRSHMRTEGPCRWGSTSPPTATPPLS